ncbi:MAG TPA: N-acetyltransferase [Bryobacteraceae bacterium]
MIIRRLGPEDRDAVRDALIECGAFSAEEVRVALEMLDSGLAGEYSLPAVEIDGRVRAYACMGKATLTLGSWYLYWICVHPAFQRTGIGRVLQARLEEIVRDSGGTQLVVETSGRPDYERTRHFYLQAGFTEVGRIPDFYKPGDDCVLYCKVLGGTA